MELSIVIVNWNSKDYLRRCIESIVAETHDLDFEIIVIDSASFDGCGQMLRDEYPQVHFIQSQKNLGFAMANNLAFQSSTGDYILFLNPDTELRGPAINILIDQLRLLPNSGALGPKLLNSDGSIQTTCIQSFPTVLNQFLNCDLLRRLFPRSPLWGIGALFAKDISPSEADSISGACLMISRSLFEKVGHFSTDYFMYAEDVDLCFKARRLGMRNYYVPQAVVVHHGGTSSAKSEISAFSNVMLLESRWRFFRKTKSSVYANLFRTSVVTASFFRIPAALALSLLERLTRRTTGKTALRKWNARLRWALGCEEWVKRF